MGKVRFGTIIQTASRYIGESTPSSPKAENPTQIRKQEAEKLEKFIFNSKLWIDGVDFNRFMSQGAEQRVLLKNSKTVLKLNEAVYYGSWREYLYNLLLHNFFISDTVYELLGFTKEIQNLYAVVQQAYVSTTENTDLYKVKMFLESNGFINFRNNVYYNPELGIILEDLHDENVLTKNEIHFFIDTVFYLIEQFWIEQ